MAILNRRGMFFLLALIAQCQCKVNNVSGKETLISIIICILLRNPVVQHIQNTDAAIIKGFLLSIGYNSFYLSSGGSDTSTCGATTSTACETLEYVLSLYYNTTHKPEMGLEIITSTSLIIDEHIMVSNIREINLIKGILHSTVRSNTPYTIRWLPLV